MRVVGLGVVVLWLTTSVFAWSDSPPETAVRLDATNNHDAKITIHAKPEVSLKNPSDRLPITNIVLEGSLKQKRKLTRWLNDIAVVPKGWQTLQAIEASGHTLLIKHSVIARISSGRTIAPMTQKITNGTGDNVTILFDATMDDRGTHRVFGPRRELIEFNAIQNLYHELAHAMHQMQGTWRYFASEKQAIEEENEFRRDLAKINGEEPRYRYYTKGVLISKLDAGGLGYQLPF